MRRAWFALQIFLRNHAPRYQVQSLTQSTEKDMINVLNSSMQAPGTMIAVKILIAELNWNFVFT